MSIKEADLNILFGGENYGSIYPELQMGGSKSILAPTIDLLSLLPFINKLNILGAKSEKLVELATELKRLILSTKLNFVQNTKALDVQIVLLD